jgi:toxin ParE1/3/4
MARYTLSPLARADLDEIWNYTVNQWSVTQADRYIRQIERAIEDIVVNPGLGRPCEEIRAAYRKHPIGSHMLFYRRQKTIIDVVRILHQSMDTERHF